MKKILKLFIILSIVLICKTSTVFGVCNTESQLDNNLSTFKYKFDLNGNGGIFERSEITVIDGKVNLPTPVRSGYTFNGYTASKDGTVEYNVSNVDIYNINSKTLYAKWNIETYKINYDLNGGTLDNIVSEYNVENDITLGVPTRTGYTFVGWTGTGISTATKNVTINKGSTGNRSYTANWTPTNYTITYNSNGGTISGQKTSYNIESESFELVTPTRTGYTFVGWTGTGINTATKNVTINKGSTGNRSYTANWTPTNYTITYNSNGGTISGQKTSYNIESESFELVTPTRTGYTFVGWTGTGISTATKNVTINKGSTGNRSYTANWVDDIKPDIYKAWITSGPYYEIINGRYGYTVNIQVSCGDSGSGINRVLTYYENSTGWVGETNITSTMTDSFWFIPGYRRIKIVVYDNAGNSSETIIAVQCG